MNNNVIKKCAAEFLGTFALVFFGCGSMILYEINPIAISVDSIPIIFGLVVAVMIYAFSNISGAHFNPAVSIAFCINKSIKIPDLYFYIPSQVLGAILASCSHRYFFGDSHTFGMTINRLSQSQGFMLEVLISIFLMLTIVTIASNKKVSNTIIGFSVGGIISVCSFVAGPFTGASMNPARSLGPAIASGNFDSIGIYIVAPIVGTSLSILIFNYLNQKGES